LTGLRLTQVVIRIENILFNSDVSQFIRQKGI
jgi:hypothetical protein